MKITVIVCTFNRCQMLPTMLDSVAASKLPPSVDWEVLVVDNNSSDQTQGAVERFCRQYPGRFRYVFEPKPGKTYALNTGIHEAGGDVLAFIDDDVIVEPTWLRNLTLSLNDGEWGGSGGRTLPEQSFSPPPWLPREGHYGLAPLAVFDLGSDPCELTEPPFGNNMAFRKAMFEKHGGFRLDLGPRAGSRDPQKSEDSEFGHRLLDAGERLRYEPSAVVYHAVPPGRVMKKYFLGWWFDKARADIRAFGIPRDAKWRVGGIPLSLFRRLAVWSLRWMATVQSSRRFSCKIKVWVLGGEIFECYRLSRNKMGVVTAR